MANEDRNVTEGNNGKGCFYDQRISFVGESK